MLVVCALVLGACADATPSTPGASIPEWARVAPEQIAKAKKHSVSVAFENDLRMRFVLIQAGTFVMGSPQDEEGRDNDETQHAVTISNPFYMQITEVTTKQYRQFDYSYTAPLGAYEFYPWLGDHANPAGVSHADALRFASWEYACRAGTRTPYWWGDDASLVGRYENTLDPAHQDYYWTPDSDHPLAPPEWDDGHALTAPVASFPPNPWGLYDMLGNVSEWCGGWYGPYHDRPSAKRLEEAVMRLVYRGGTYHATVPTFRAANREACSDRLSPYARVGFRLVSPLPEKRE